MATLDALLDAALGSFLGLYGTGLGNVQVLDVTESHKILRILAHKGFQPPFLSVFAEVRADSDSACGRALRARRTIIVPDVEEDAPFAPYRAVAREAGFRGVVSTPMISKWGHLVGVISTHFVEPCSPAELIVARGEAFAQRLAHDVLTLVDPRLPPKIANMYSFDW